MGYNGLAIELKIGEGKPSDYQKEWQQALTVRGYKALIMPSGLQLVDGLAWLKKKVREYLGMPKEKLNE